MSRVRFTVMHTTVGGVSDSAIVLDDENPLDALKEAIWQAVSLDVTVTIADVTMFAAGWEDPEHWSDEWASALGVSADDAPGAERALIEGATNGD